jgi:hypothetical protein
MLALTTDDLIEYTAWQRARWRSFLREHPDALRLAAGPASGVSPPSATW